VDTPIIQSIRFSAGGISAVPFDVTTIKRFQQGINVWGYQVNYGLFWEPPLIATLSPASSITIFCDQNIPTSRPTTGYGNSIANFRPWLSATPNFQPTENVNEYYNSELWFGHPLYFEPNSSLGVVISWNLNGATCGIGIDGTIYYELNPKSPKKN
jgi:hypothetical protein